MSVGHAIIEIQQRKVTLMNTNITTIVFHIFTGTTELHPAYEVHSWEKAQEIIDNTKALLVDKPNATFSFEVLGNSTSHLW